MASIKCGEMAVATGIPRVALLSDKWPSLAADNNRVVLAAFYAGF